MTSKRKCGSEKETDRIAKQCESGELNLKQGKIRKKDSKTQGEYELHTCAYQSSYMPIAGYLSWRDLTDSGVDGVEESVCFVGAWHGSVLVGFGLGSDAHILSQIYLREKKDGRRWYCVGLVSFLWGNNGRTFGVQPCWHGCEGANLYFRGTSL